MATVNTQVRKYVDDTVVLSGYANMLTTRTHKKKTHRHLLLTVTVTSV